MQFKMNWLGIFRTFWQNAGPYLMLEMLMPGGTLLALALFLYQRARSGTGHVPPRTGASDEISMPCVP